MFSAAGEATGSTVVTVVVGAHLVSSFQVWGGPLPRHQTAGAPPRLSQSQGLWRIIAFATPCC